MQPTKLYGRHKRHIEDLKKQNAACLDGELTVLAKERSERAERLGLDGKILGQNREVSGRGPTRNRLKSAPALRESRRTAFAAGFSVTGLI